MGGLDAVDGVVHGGEQLRSAVPVRSVGVDGGSLPSAGVQWSRSPVSDPQRPPWMPVYGYPPGARRHLPPDRYRSGKAMSSSRRSVAPPAGLNAGVIEMPPSRV